jgi:hypothetical protein
MELIGDARFVLLGEASHGTHEFYRERAQVTKRLIKEKGFTAVAVEADWPDAYRVNRYVRGQGGDAIFIILGGGAREHVTHNINGPSHVRLEQTEDGADMTLQIESGGDVTTLVRWTSTATRRSSRRRGSGTTTWCKPCSSRRRT